jgi:hypothetical protein
MFILEEIIWRVFLNETIDEVGVLRFDQYGLGLER